MRVVVLSPQGVVDLAALGGSVRSGNAAASVIAATTEGDADIVVAGPGPCGRRVRATCERTMPGRILMRLTWMDPGVTFWRAVRSDRRAVQALRAADLIVAPDRDAVFAAWKAARRVARTSRQPAVVFGYPAARSYLDGVIK